MLHYAQENTWKFFWVTSAALHGLYIFNLHPTPINIVPFEPEEVLDIQV